MSQHTRPSLRVRRCRPEIFESLKLGLPNQTVQRTDASRLAQTEMQTSSAAGSRR